MLTVHATQQNSLIGSIPKIGFSLVETMSSISWSLHDFSQQDFNHAHSLDNIHVMHLTFCGRTLMHTLFEIVYKEEKEPQNKSMPIF